MRSVAAALSTAARTPLQDADADASTQPLQDADADASRYQAALCTASRTPLQGAGAEASYTGESDSSVHAAAEEGGGAGGGGLHRDVTTHSAAWMYIGEHTLRARSRMALTKPHAPPQH